MKTAWKRGLVAVGATLAVFAVARVGAYVQAGRSLRAYVETHRDAVAEEHAKLHATRLPSLDGPPSSARCADAQAALLRAYRDPPPGYAAVVDGWPASRVSPDARAWVETRAADLDDLRATLTCMQTLDEAGSTGSMSSSLRLGRAARSFLVDGLVRAENGDAAGAVERVLDAIRLGEQIGASAGSMVLPDAILALARVIGSTPGASLDRAAQGLDALAPFVPAPTAIADDMKRLLVDAATDDDPDPIGKLDAPRYEGIQGLQRARMRLGVLLLPRRAIVASAVAEIDSQLDRAIEALQSGSADRQREVEDALGAENAKTANPIVWLTAVPSTIALGRRIGRARCALAVARATFAVERTRDASGRYGSPPMPDDACAHGSSLRFELLAGGAGYRVWSVGVNGKDESGRHAVSWNEDDPDDLVVGTGLP